jgi:hypothetical protein
MYKAEKRTKEMNMHSSTPPLLHTWKGKKERKREKKKGEKSKEGREGKKKEKKRNKVVKK